MRKIVTIKDMADWQEWYRSQMGGIPHVGTLLKADAPVLTTTIGVRNIIYGARAMEQVITEANVSGVLQKKPYEKGGFRAITARGKNAGIGIPQAGAIPDTVKPTFAEINWSLKECAESFDESTWMKAVEGKDDTMTWDQFVQYMSKEFGYCLNADLTCNNDIVAGNNFESIDRVCASHAEIAYGKVDNSAALDANDLDIYGLDRDAAASWADAYVSGQAFGLGERTLGLNHIDSLLTNCRPYWDSPKNKVWLTGYDTLERWQQLLQAQQRFMGEAMVSVGINGVQTVEGVAAGFAVSTYRNIPIIETSTALKDTLSRIYLLDLDHVWLSLDGGIEYLESADYQALDKFAVEGVYHCLGELVADKFRCHGKVRDLK